MKKEDTATRLKKVMSEKGLRQIDIYNKAQVLCKKYNIKLGRNDLSQYLSGKVEPGQSKIALLAEVLNVNPVWLMGLDVPMYDQKDFLFGSELEKMLAQISKELNVPVEKLKSFFINYKKPEVEESQELNYDNLYKFFSKFFKEKVENNLYDKLENQEKYIKILKQKGLMDENGYISDENLEKLEKLVDVLIGFDKDKNNKLKNNK